MEPIDWSLGEPNQGNQGGTFENNAMLTEEVADDYYSPGNSPRKD